jgi:hypothetical protein
MRHSKTFFNQPELMANDAHGVYMMQLAFDSLLPIYKNQAAKQLSKQTIADIEAGPECEYHFEACDLLTNVTFCTPSGQKWSLQYAEGGVWAIPACFARTKAANDFFGC